MKFSQLFCLCWLQAPRKFRKFTPTASYSGNIRSPKGLQQQAQDSQPAPCLLANCNAGYESCQWRGYMASESIQWSMAMRKDRRRYGRRQRPKVPCSKSTTREQGVVTEKGGQGWSAWLSSMANGLKKRGISKGGKGRGRGKCLF